MRCSSNGCASSTLVDLPGSFSQPLKHRIFRAGIFFTGHSHVKRKFTRGGETQSEHAFGPQAARGESKLIVSRPHTADRCRCHVRSWSRFQRYTAHRDNNSNNINSSERHKHRTAWYVFSHQLDCVYTIHPSAVRAIKITYAQLIFFSEYFCVNEHEWLLLCVVRIWLDHLIFYQ